MGIVPRIGRAYRGCGTSPGHDPGDLVEFELIHRLRYRYVRFMDTKRWDDLAGLFVPDATASYGGGAGELEGVPAIIEFLRGSMGDEAMLTSYKVHHPEITLTGPDTAEGVGARRRRHPGPLEMTVRGASYYEDRYAKVDGEWLIAHRLQADLRGDRAPPGGPAAHRQLVGDRWPIQAPLTWRSRDSPTRRTPARPMVRRCPRCLALIP